VGAALFSIRLPDLRFRISFFFLLSTPQPIPTPLCAFCRDFLGLCMRFLHSCRPGPLFTPGALDLPVSAGPPPVQARTPDNQQIRCFTDVLFSLFFHSFTENLLRNVPFLPDGNETRLFFPQNRFLPTGRHDDCSFVLTSNSSLFLDLPRKCCPWLFSPVSFPGCRQ